MGHQKYLCARCALPVPCLGAALNARCVSSRAYGAHDRAKHARCRNAVTSSTYRNENIVCAASTTVSISRVYHISFSPGRTDDLRVCAARVCASRVRIGRCAKLNPSCKPPIALQLLCLWPLHFGPGACPARSSILRTRCEIISIRDAERKRGIIYDQRVFSCTIVEDTNLILILAGK